MTRRLTVPRAIIVTGTCGSGKTTASTLLAVRFGWVRVSEDDIWREFFGKNRSPFGSDEHRRKRWHVHASVYAACCAALEAGQNIVIDATVHEAPPEAYQEYREFFEAHGIKWRLRVLHPKLEVAVARDAIRSTGRVGGDRVASLRAKFTGTVFGPECFLDNSEDNPEQTVQRLLEYRAA
jgi:predicted kinase